MRLFVTVIAAFLVLSTAALANVHVLLSNGSGDYASIQSAANASVTGDVIVLKSGTYAGASNRNIDFAGKAITITSAGGASTCVIDCQNLGQGFLFDSTEGPGSVLNGVTVRNANGYGIYCANDGSPTIVGCVIEACANGIYIGMGDPHLINCDIRNNSTAGIRTGASSVGNLINCRIDDNDGFGIDGFSGDLDIVGGELRGNLAGIHAYQNAFFRLVGCVVTGNGTPTSGGGIYASEGVFSVRDCTISGNRATRGGGIYVAEDGFLYLKHSIVWDNCATSGGDEVYLEGSSLLMNVTCCDLDGSGITGNYSLNGPSTFTNPCFCDPRVYTAAPTVAGDYRLCATSPCLPGASPCGRLIGALEQGCSTPAGLQDDDPPERGHSLLLSEPKPNPASQEVSFEVEARPGETLRLEVVDANGRLCAAFAAGEKTGPQRVIWDGRLTGGRLAPGGVYFLHATAAGKEESRRFVLVR